jgi:hypothetical protein
MKNAGLVAALKVSMQIENPTQAELGWGTRLEDYRV